jgi:hypothetical protein
MIIGILANKHRCLFGQRAVKGGEIQFDNLTISKFDNGKALFFTSAYYQIITSPPSPPFPTGLLFFRCRL